MPLFDAYVMVDWSGGNGRRFGQQDCIWIAHGAVYAAAPETANPSSRTKAEHLIRSLIEPFVASSKGRVLVCADFAYGYPAGFASLLPNTDGRAPPWRAVWQYLKQHLEDDIGTVASRPPTNRQGPTVHTVRRRAPRRMCPIPLGRATAPVCTGTAPLHRNRCSVLRACCNFRPSRDIFTRAAAIVAKRAAQGGASTDDVEVIVARGVAQAAALREAAS